MTTADHAPVAEPENAEDEPNAPPERALLVIAIDGPAGSGKSTVARAVAEATGVEYLDTGAMYRAVVVAAAQADIDVEDAAAIGELSRAMALDVSAAGVTVNGADATAEIRTPDVTRHVSTVAANPDVRDEMRRRQRSWAEARGGGVMEGRDIGTVVFPDAALKVYLTASVAERARRRALEAGLDPAEVEADMLRRDTADSTRKHAPLAQADDAIVVDTTDLSIDGVVAVIAEHVDALRSEPPRSEAGTTHPQL